MRVSARAGRRVAVLITLEALTLPWQGTEGVSGVL